MRYAFILEKFITCYCFFFLMSFCLINSRLSSDCCFRFLNAISFVNYGFNTEIETGIFCYEYIVLIQSECTIYSGHCITTQTITQFLQFFTKVLVFGFLDNWSMYKMVYSFAKTIETLTSA